VGRSMTIEELRNEKWELERYITKVVQPLLEQFTERTQINIYGVDIGVRESDLSTSIGNQRYYFTKVFLELGI
jgi:hypothetical protein